MKQIIASVLFYNMKQIKASVFFGYYLILLGISYFVFINLIILAARVYKLRVAEIVRF